MKKSILFFATSLLLFACGSSEPEQKTEVNQTENKKEENSPEAVNKSDRTQIVSNKEGTTTKKVVQTKTNVIQDKPSSESEQYNQLVGTWLFTKATAGGSDRTTKYPWGYLNSKAKKMTLHADGRIQYEEDVVNAMKIEKATWKIEKHETKDFYYFVTTRIADGVTETSKEKILSSSDKQFIFGKRFTVEYTSSNL